MSLDSDASMAAIDKVKVLIVGDSVKCAVSALAHDADRHLRYIYTSKILKAGNKCSHGIIISQHREKLKSWAGPFPDFSSTGVGKSCLTHLIAHNEPIHNPTWTVGCSVEVKLHEFKEGTQHQKSYFIELWDIGGSSNHRNTRSVFYNSVHGIIFVHDLTNRKSQQNLKHWLAEVFNKEGGKSKQVYDEYDNEQFAGSSMIPMIFIGTKLDLAEEKRLNGTDKGGDIAQDWGADKLFLDCRDGRSLSPGSSASVKLSRFFDKVIEMRFHRHDGMSPTCFDKRRSFPTSPMSPKLYLTD